MNFTEYNQRLSEHFKEMLSSSHKLYVLRADSEELWNLYLDSFPEGTNQIFRKRREYDCSCCHSFVKKYGGIVTIDNDDGYKITTLWDFDGGDFNSVNVALDSFLRTKEIANVFCSYDELLGANAGIELTSDGVITWNHFRLMLPKNLTTRKSDSIDLLIGKSVENMQSLMRATTEIAPLAVSTALELIANNDLYRGEEHQNILRNLQKLQYDYMKVPENLRKNFFWKKSQEVGAQLCYIRNSMIGTLLCDLTDETDPNDAVAKFEAKYDGYKRPKPVFTQKMIDDAEKTLTNLGLLDSIQRRFAVESDVSVQDVLWVNRSVAPNMKDADIFAKLGQNAKPQKSSGIVNEMTINELLDMLPSVTAMSIKTTSELSGNLVSLIAPQNAEAKSMFKWGNGYSWAYTGNSTMTKMKEAVKRAGGKITGDLRFSISWEHDDDLDAHCFMGSEHIYYGNKQSKKLNGELDVDIIHPVKNTLSVENIVFPDRAKMPTGGYSFSVKDYNHRTGRGGFKAEIEFDGRVYYYKYVNDMLTGDSVDIATVTYKNGTFVIDSSLPYSTSGSSNEWGGVNDKLYPAKMVTVSPNHWGDSRVGNKHYIFVVDGLLNPEKPSGFFNEYLIEELNPHRKVLEGMTQQMRVEDSANQLSGFGFESTVRKTVVMEIETCDGKRMVNVKF